MNINEMIVPPDPKNPKSVQQTMEYIMHCRLGSDHDEDPGLIKFFREALCHELHDETHHIDLVGLTEGRTENEDYLVVLYLVEQLCLIYKMEFDTPQRQLQRIVERNERIASAQEITHGW